MTNLAMIVFGTQAKEVPTTLSSTVITVGGLRTTWQRLLVVAGALVVFGALHWFVTRTKLGKAMRAMSQNREACAVVGVDVQKVALVTFAVSAALAGIAAALVTPLFNILPDMGALLALKAFPAGHVGSLSLAHPAFFGIGAYAAALLATEAKWPFVAGLAAAVLAAGAAALLIGVPVFRLAEHSLAIGTLGFAMVTHIVILNWVDF